MGCHTRDADQGSIRLTARELVGAYNARLESGAERLVLNSNGTYLQEFTIRSQPTQHTGHWHVYNELLNGSVVVLTGAIVNENAPPLQAGELRLYVHRRSGKIALVRNEIADWYYERTDAPH